jgi:hypothetical protein
LVDQIAASTLIVFDAEDIAGDFDQVALQFTTVPVIKDTVALRSRVQQLL